MCEAKEAGLYLLLPDSCRDFCLDLGLALPKVLGPLK